jgi:subtilase family serine protease
VIFVPAGKSLGGISPDNTYAEYPASISCLYGMGPSYAGCTPSNNGLVAVGGWGGIALVDAYDQPNMGSDLKFFDSFFLLPAANFTKVYANSSFGTLGGLTASCSGKPAAGGWDLEESLDVEWAHAMAPSAKLFLIEACTNSYNDLLYAEYVAGLKVSAVGGGEISNSWGSGEFSTEVNTVDDFFYRYFWQHITYFASAGDSGWGAAYPSSSPWVVSAGGTTINRDGSGNFVNESCWAGSGGGVSAYETWQSPPNIFNGMGPWSPFQYPFAGQGARQTPDIAADADPASGVWVYDTYGGGTWYIVGGTSVASPVLAGIVNNSQNRLGQAPSNGGYYSTQENNFIYSQLFSHKGYVNNFYDVTTGSNGVAAGAGYDQCTGVGSPRNKGGK